MNPWMPPSEETGGLSYDPQEAADRAAEQAEADQMKLAVKVVERIIRFHHDEWAQHTVCPWQRVSDLLGECMRHPDFAAGEEWADELQKFAKQSGWPAVWVCYAEAMSQQIREAAAEKEEHPF